jgi:lipopolysaccharide/colanic/teichoic acid biosynthesis glycosyltransferase
MFKRLFDITVVMVALVLLSPVIFIISRKIAKNLGKLVFFRPNRPGFNVTWFNGFDYLS